MGKTVLIIVFFLLTKKGKDGIIMAIEDKDGVWRTIRGRRVFIKDGESLEQALERSKKAYNSQDNKAVELIKKINENQSQKKIKQLPAYDDLDKSIQQIQDYTGYDKTEAKKAYDTIKYYTSNGYSDIRVNKNSEEAKTIEDFIEKHPKFDGKIFRGIGFEKHKGIRYLRFLFNSLNNNTTIDMDGISSWSSEESIAEDFANNRNQAEDSYRFIFESENKSGVGIDHLSNWVGENEVLHSSKTQYKVKKIIQKENGKSPLYRILLEEV